MSESPVPGWAFVRVVQDGETLHVGGVSPWDFDWKQVDGSIEVPHPEYPTQRHELNIWQMETDQGCVVFAAGELSSGVWCFYIQGTTA